MHCVAAVLPLLLSLWRNEDNMLAGSRRIPRPYTTSRRHVPAVRLCSSTSGSVAVLPHEPANKAHEESLVWRNHFWPIAFVKDLDAAVPRAFTVLSVPLVVWRDSAGEWRALADRCPHRLVPLSEGRVDEHGRLECGYHGWAFEGGGACTGMPHEAADSPLRGSKRACATAYQTLVVQGVLYVRPVVTGCAEYDALPPALVRAPPPLSRCKCSLRSFEGCLTPRLSHRWRFLCTTTRRSAAAPPISRARSLWTI